MKKLTAIALVLAMTFSMSACGETKQTEETRNYLTEAAEETKSDTIISGTIKSVDDDRITITCEDGSEKTFTVSDTTEYSIEMGEMPGGNGQQGGTPPEMPDGNEQQGGTPPEMPEGNGQQGGTPPEMPEGNGQQGGTPPEMQDGNGQQGGMPPEMHGENGEQGETPPEKPEDNGEQGGTPPEKPDGNEEQGGIPPEIQDGHEEMQAGPDMLTEGTSITATISNDGTATEIKIKMNGKGFGGFNGGNETVEYSSANTFEASDSLSGETYSSTGKDENAILVTGGEVSFDDINIERISSDSTGGDNASFYGVGAALLATDGTVSISNSTIKTDAAGGAGVFAYGNGTAYVSDTEISTVQNTAGGIHVAGGGTLYAWNLDVETDGESSAAIRSDRGSGTMVIDGGNYTSNGIGSPAIYSTADITVNNSNLTANNSEAICIEGKNNIRLYDCNLSGNMSDDSRNDCTWNVILYQSMSGDSDVGNSLFEMVGGTLTSNNGGIFYTTNTESTFVISDVDIVTSDDCEFLLKCTGNSNQRGWGSEGKNGANCTFSAVSQELTGDVIWDSISTLDFYMKDGSTLKGAFVMDESNTSDEGNGYASLYIGEGCTWTVTGNSTLTSLYLAGSIIDENGQNVTVVGTDGTFYVSGDSDIVITVDAFTESSDLSGCAVPSSFDSYAVERK